jgi:type II secretory pathway predicted ATPase ExeA
MNANIHDNQAPGRRDTISSATDSDSFIQRFGKTRNELLLNHPLLSQEILIPTLAIERLYLTIKRAVVLRESGIYVSGISGAGKTKALVMISAMLESEFPGLCIVRLDERNYPVASIRAFFMHYLKVLGHRHSKGETFHLRERVSNGMIDLTRASTMKVVLLLIDEAHQMQTAEFKYLKDVYNDLDCENIQLVTILMGQSPEINGAYQRLLHEGKDDLIGRFMLRHVQFKAFAGKDDLASVFRAIDKAVYPAESGISWTAFFFPKAFSHGFRLENEAPRMMEAITRIGPAEGVSVGGFPARQAFQAIRNFLIDNSEFDAPDMRLPDDAWLNAVDLAHLQAMMELQAAKIENHQIDVEV